MLPPVAILTTACFSALAPATLNGLRIDTSPLVTPVRVGRPLLALVEVSEACAAAQREAYFSLMPSKALPKTSLDLRAWAPKDKDSVEAGVFARQTSTVPQWSNIGVVACESVSDLAAAVAKQRPLIERWAYECLNDFETNRLRIDLAEPVELAWAIRPPAPSLLESLMGAKAEEPMLSVVPREEPFDDLLRCGFLGKLSRDYRGGGVSARAERIVIGKEPETPARRKSQEQFDKVYDKKKEQNAAGGRGRVR